MNHTNTSVLNRLRISALIVLLLTLTGCASIENFFSSSAPEDMNLNMPAKTLIEKGMEEYNKGKYYLAVEYFNKVLDSHRFTPQALLAELKIADCAYYMKNYQEAYLYYERFEEMHPTNEAIPYVMYQKAMCHYKRIDIIDRDISGAQKAIDRFQLLLNAYPDSPYTADARAKIATAKEFLANHEYSVVQFYLRTDKENQAIFRLKQLLVMYPQSDIIPQAKTLLSKLEAQAN